MQEFHDLVSMIPAEPKHWLASDESRFVGVMSGGEKVTSSGGGEAVGHHMGERIVEIKATKHADLTDDYANTRKIIGYVHRHGAQQPEGDATDTRWHKSLMNWGHDPLK